MALIDKLKENKELFYIIFDTQNERYEGEGYDELIDSHLSEWCSSRIMGGSASMSFEISTPNGIKLIDRLADEYFKEGRQVIEKVKPINMFS